MGAKVAQKQQIKHFLSGHRIYVLGYVVVRFWGILAA
jgi:hypothetical protein